MNSILAGLENLEAQGYWRWRVLSRPKTDERFRRTTGERVVVHGISSHAASVIGVVQFERYAGGLNAIGKGSLVSYPD